MSQWVIHQLGRVVWFDSLGEVEFLMGLHCSHLYNGKHQFSTFQVADEVKSCTEKGLYGKHIGSILPAKSTVFVLCV